MKDPIFVTAIGTNSGKTIFSAILVEALQADYWKPIQSGIEDRDLETVEKLISNPKSILFAERFLLKNPVSPHQAAALEGISIKLNDFEIPKTLNQLVIEGAGGVLVPINLDGDCISDLIIKLNASVILVSNLYLGSINHTLLTVSYLKSQNIAIKGIVFNGLNNQYSKDIIIKKTGLKVLLTIEQEEIIDQKMIKKYAHLLNLNLI